MLIGSYGSQKIYTYLTSVIDRLGKCGKIMYLSGCTKRYYATILAHAFAPLNSTESFFGIVLESVFRGYEFYIYEER